MLYPIGFPPHLQALVESALANAEIALQKRLDELSERSLPPQNARDERGNYAGLFVIDVLRAFLPGANEAARQGFWSVTRERTAVDEILENQLIPLGYMLARVDGPHPSPSAVAGFRAFLLKEIKRTDLWLAHLDEWHRVAEELIANSVVTGAPPQAPTEPFNTPQDEGSQPQKTADESIELPAEPRGKVAPTSNDRAEDRRQAVGFGRTLQAFMDECGWNVTALEQATDIDRKRIIAHLYHRVFPRAEGLLAYAKAFTEKLGRTVTVEELRHSHRK